MSKTKNNVKSAMGRVFGKHATRCLPPARSFLVYSATPTAFSCGCLVNNHDLLLVLASTVGNRLAVGARVR